MLKADKYSLNTGVSKMPEGVEVKLSVDLIKPLVVGKKIISMGVGPSSRYRKNPPEGMVNFQNAISSWHAPTRITDVMSKGKFMYWSFANGHPQFDWHMMCTFGMSGQWALKEGKHPCFWFSLVDDTAREHRIYFNDPRHFGSIKFVHSYALLKRKLNELGWDPLAHGMDDKWLNYVIGALSKTSKPIGQILMDQGVFAGVGNYIRAEALYLARMSPWRPSNFMKKEDIITLCQCIVDVMNESYKHQGATILTYKDAFGAEGKFASCFKVYRKETDPLGNKIVKEETPDKRTIHWCPAVQT